jgi:8-oxo-dGTP diphosphatase
MKRSLLHSLALVVMRLYWRLLRPKTFGVKVVVNHPQLGSSAIALVRNTYGRSDVWTLPGGGYRPSKETPEAAAAREVREELGLEVSRLTIIGEYQTQAEGKRDTVTFVKCTARSDSLRINDEVAEVVWCKPEDIGRTYKTFEVTIRAVASANAG